jgi:hypothetical protein
LVESVVKSSGDVTGAASAKSCPPMRGPALFDFSLLIPLYNAYRVCRVTYVASLVSLSGLLRVHPVPVRVY